MARKHHHLVSEGYQRFFADPTGIRLVDKQTRKARVVGTKSAFARKHFSSYIRDGVWSDELEDEWSSRENFAIPHARRLIAGARDAESRDALKILAAIHYVRSYAFEIILDRIMAEQKIEAPGRIAAERTVIQAFVDDHGREPQPGEIEQIVLERWLELNEGRRLLVSEMADGFNKVMKILDPLKVQLVWPRKRNYCHFVFGDTPLVHYSNDGRLSALGGLALGDANKVYFPVGPLLAAFFTVKRFADGAIEGEMVQALNRKTWHAATRFIGAHPGSNLKRSLSIWDLTIES